MKPTAEQNAFDELIEELRALWFALRAASAQIHADIECTAIERGAMFDLLQLGPQTVPAMARARAISRQAMQKTIDRLAARGWVHDEPNPAHERSALIALSPAGGKILADMRAREVAGIAGLELPAPAELRRAARVLATIRAQLGAPR